MRFTVGTWDCTVVSAGTALAALGHTPGQVALRIESEGETLLHMADVIAHPLHMDHLAWTIIADIDPDQAVRTRRDLVGRAAAEEIPLFVYHFPQAARIVRRHGNWQTV